MKNPYNTQETKESLQEKIFDLMTEMSLEFGSDCVSEIIELEESGADEKGEKLRCQLSDWACDAIIEAVTAIRNM